MRWWLILPFVVVLALGSSAAIQATAWIGMLANRTLVNNWESAVQTTFDGKHPCPLCRLADQVSQVETTLASRSSPSPKGTPVDPVTKTLKTITDLISDPALTPHDGSGTTTLPLWAVSVFPDDLRLQPEPPPPRAHSGFSSHI